MISVSSKPVSVQRAIISDFYSTYCFSLYIAMNIMYAKGSRRSRPMQILSASLHKVSKSHLHHHH